MTHQPPPLESVLTLRERTGPAPLPEGRPGAIWHGPDGGVRGQATIGPEDRWLKWESAGLFRFRPGVTTVDVWQRHGIGSTALRATFAHEVQPLVLQSLGFETMQGASAAGMEGGVALCGKAGTGKSTLAFALGRRGWTELSDDHVIFDFAGARPRLRSAPFQPRLSPEATLYFGQPVIEPMGPTGLRDWRPLAAVLIVESDADADEWVTATPVEPAAALSEILLYAHAFDPDDEAEAARLATNYLTLVERVPVYRLRYRRSFARLDDVVDCVQRVIRRLARGGTAAT